MHASPPLTVVIAGGSSGGHLFPALTLARELQERHQARVVFLVNDRALALLEHVPLPQEKGEAGERTNVDEHQHRETGYCIVRSPRMRSRFDLIGLAAHFIHAGKIMTTYRPSCVVGFGSSLSFSLVLTAWLRRIPTVIHEQNVSWGIANSLLRFCATRVAVSFPPTGKQLPRIVETGNLIRPETRAYCGTQRTIHAAEPVNIFVVGGSQGAQFLNQAVTGMVACMTAEERRHCVLWHMTGSARSVREVDEVYRTCGIEHTVFAFDADIGKYYQQADIVISRAGAGTLFELMAFGIPSILIPYPFARAHQVENARYLERATAAVVIEQHEARPERLKELVWSLVSDHDRRDRMRACVKRLARPLAHEHLARIVIEVASQTNAS